jgi:hypothetical protein
MDKMPEIKIGKRSIPLFYSTYETIAIQREIGCTAFQLKDTVFGTETIDEDKEPTLDNIRLTVDKDPDKMEKLGILIKILGNAGLEESGQEPDLTAKWILRNMKPVMIPIYAMVLMGVIVAGNIMEAKEDKPKNEETDVILEEENAKKQPEN